MELRQLAVVIPAYQAEAFVGPVIRRTLEITPHVLTVDDGSTDNTSDVAKRAGARVLRHSKNLGKGRALKTGFDDLFPRGFEQLVTLDADGQHLPEEIPKLLEGMRWGADLVIGSRDHVFSEMHGIRRTSNRCSSRIISSLAGQRVPDVQSGFRCYSRNLIEKVGFPEPRFEAESAIIVRAVRKGFAVVCVPIELGFADGRSTSHYRPLVDSLRIAGAVTRARMEGAEC